MHHVVSPRPISGPALLATPEWKQAVRDAMAAKKPPWSQARLAREIGCAQPTVTRALKRETERSRLVGPICELLDIPYPEMPITSAKAAKLLAIAESLPDTQIDMLVALAETFLRANEE